ELTFGEAAGAQETIERGSRKAGLVRFAGGGQFAQKSGAGAMRVLAFESFDESGGVRCDGAGLPAVLTRLGRQSFQSVAAIAQGPVQQCIHRDLAAGGMRNVVEAGGDLLRAAREFAAGQRLQHQGRNQTVTEERDFFSFVVHGVVFSPGRQLTAEDGEVPCKWCVGRLKRAPRGRRMRRGGRREPDRKASPTGGSGGRRTRSGEQRPSRWIRAWPGRGGGNRAREQAGSTRPAPHTALRPARGSGGSRTARAGTAWKAARMRRRSAMFAHGTDGR